MILLARMGCRFLLTCPGCGYSAEISGAPDCGFVSATETVHCFDCRELYDIITSQRASEKENEPWVDQPRHCPEQEGHRIEEWTLPGPCPHCAHLVTQDNAQIAALWD